MRITLHPRYSNNTDITSLVSRLPEAFANNEGELLYDKRNQVRRFVMPDGMRLMVKQFKRPNLIQKLCYSTCWTNKADKSYRYGFRLLEMGLDTPEPIASIVYRRHGMVDRYYFVSAEDEGSDCREWLEKADATAQDRAIQALAGFLVKAHRLGFLHGDTNLSNFRLHPVGDGFRLAVIDTNRSTFVGKPASHEQCIRNLCRLSHQRDLIEAIARAYARQGGLDPDKTFREVLAATEKFENRKAVTHKLKGIFKPRR